MSLTYAQIFHLHQEAWPQLKDAECLRVISPAPRCYILVLRKDKVDRHLFFCFDHGFVRFHLLGHIPDKINNDPFAKALNDNLAGLKLTGFDIVNEDRILELDFSGKKPVCKLVAELFPRRPNCLLVDGKGMIVVSLHPPLAHQYSPPEKPGALLPEPGFGTDAPLMGSSEAEAYYAGLESLRDREKRRRDIAKMFDQRLRKAEKRVEERRRLLEACEGHAEVHHEGVLLQANLYRLKKGAKEAVVEDWEKEGAERVIPLDPETDPKDTVAALFLKAKKLHLGLPHAREQLNGAEKNLREVQAQLREMEELTSHDALEHFAQRLSLFETTGAVGYKAKRPEPAKPYHLFKSETGTDILVGKSAKDNDLLTFTHANGLDWWLHARDCPGSHVVIRCGKGSEPDAESLADAAELALRYSKVKDERRGDVCLTQVKAVSKVRGIPGKVMLSKHKVLHVVCDDKRWNRLRHSKN